MNGTPITETKIKNNQSQHLKGQESEWLRFRDILLPSLASLLHGPDGILSLPWETALGFAYHQQGVQTSARTLILSPSP